MRKRLTSSHSDATSATLKPNVAGQDTAAVNAIYESNIASINTAITGATADVKSTLASPAPAKRGLALASRQATVSLPAELALITAEIGGTLSAIVATLGLRKLLFPVLMVDSTLIVTFLAATLPLLGPLVATLGGLVAALLPVVNDLVTVVGDLLNGVLGGLSAALLALLTLL